MLVATLHAASYAPAVIPILAALVGWGGRALYRHWRKSVTAAISDAENEAKDDLIETLERNHRALVERVELLEHDLEEERGHRQRLGEALEEKTNAFNVLKTYAAPDGFARLQALGETNGHLLGNVLERLTQVEQQQTTATEALTDAVTLLREVVQTR